MLGPIALLVESPIADPEVINLIMALILEIDHEHEIFSTAILLLPLIQEGFLSAISESMCTEYWSALSLSLLRKWCGFWLDQLTILTCR